MATKKSLKGANTEYLLDTSVWRALNEQDERRLASARSAVRLSSNCVVPFELVSGLPPQEDERVAHEFRVRRAALRRLLKFVESASLDLRTPHDLRAQAFGILPRDQNLEFRGLIQAFASASSHDELDGLLSQARSLSRRFPTLKRLRSEADRAAQNFAAGLVEGVKTMRHTNNQILFEMGHRGKELRKLRQGFVSFLHEVGDLRRYAFLAIADTVGAASPQPASGLWDWAAAEFNRLMARYDGSIDVYIDVYAAYIAMASCGQIGSGNDLFDLDHFVYMRPSDKAQIFVTADQRLLKLGVSALPDRVIDLAAFRRLIS